MSTPRPYSLAARAAIATGLVLAGFLGLVGLTLSRANHESALNNLHDRLQNYVVAYLAGTEVSRYGKVLPPDAPPDPSFSQPGSGLYAVVVGDKGFRWVSSSAIGRDFSFLKELTPGQSRFVGPVDTRMGRLYYYAFGVAWDVPDKKPLRLTFMVAQTEGQFEGENAVYRRTLVGMLSILGVMLIVLQLLLLRWSLTPLRKVATDMARVERGKSDHLDSQYPLELTALTE
ncbi:MAG: two-component sensor histidine kinase, partial [Frateuria sp.]|nr:two-component sensor histidine kinase [Frateuria sp.]